MYYIMYYITNQIRQAKTTTPDVWSTADAEHKCKTINRILLKTAATHGLENITPIQA